MAYSANNDLASRKDITYNPIPGPGGGELSRSRVLMVICKGPFWLWQVGPQKFLMQVTPDCLGVNIPLVDHLVDIFRKVLPKVAFTSLLLFLGASRDI